MRPVVRQAADFFASKQTADIKKLGAQMINQGKAAEQILEQNHRFLTNKGVASFLSIFNFCQPEAKGPFNKLQGQIVHFNEFG